MKIVNIILTILFILFASFQFNDPDSSSWVIMYSYVAVMSALAIFKRYSLPLLIPGIAIFTIYLIYLMPGAMEWAGSGEELMNRMSDDKPFIEQAREAGGLLLGLATLIFHLVVRSRYMKALKSDR